MFIGCAATLLRPAAAAGGLRPQDVFAVLTQPANAMQAAINALPFSPAAFIDKDRDAVADWSLRSALRGLGNATASNTTAAESAFAGYSGTNNRIVYAIKKAAKFYTEVVYTGDGTTGRQIAHDLGALVGFGSVKRLDTTSSWPSFHRSATGDLVLNTTAAQTASRAIITAADAATFTVGSNADVNATGGVYEARLWAHDPDTTNGIIQCGACTGGQVNLGWPPQLIIPKNTVSASDWYMYDTARGLTIALRANSSAAESAFDLGITTNSSGFSSALSSDWKFLAIRAPV